MLGYTPYNSTNPSGYITGITGANVTSALGYTPYNSSNPNGFISGITSANVTGALGYTPYNSSNPSGFITGITSGNVTGALGYTPAFGNSAFQSKSLDTVSTPGLYQYDGAFGGTKPPDSSANYRTVEIGSGGRFSQIALPWNGDNLFFRRQQDAGWSAWRTVLHDGNYNSYSPALTGGGASGTWTINITGSAGSVAWGNVLGRPVALSAFTNDLNFITGITGANVISALGYTPYNSSNPNGYINSSGSITGSAGSVPASGISGQTGMWTSGARPGPYRLYRNDGDNAFNVQTYWTGARWRLRGYLNDSYHAEAEVGYADSAGTAGSAGSAGSISGFNNPTVAANANTIVYRDGSGHITGNYLFGSYVNSSDDVSAGNISYMMAKFGDNYHRSASAAKVAAFLSGQAMNIAGNASSANSAGTVPASGISGQAGMWTSAARPGPYRLYRNDDDSAYNVQTYYNGATGRWRLRGYYGDTYHSEAEVAYSDSSGYAGSAGSIAGFGNPTTSSTANTIVYRDASGGMQAVSVKSTSTGRWKENVRPIAGAMDIIDRLEGVYYDGRAGTVLAGQKHEPGFIAEKVAAVVPEIVGHDREGKVDSVDYSRVAPFLVEGLKETARTVRETRPEIDALRAEIRTLQKQMAEVRPVAGAAGTSLERWWELVIALFVGLAVGALLVAKSRPNGL